MEYSDTTYDKTALKNALRLSFSQVIHDISSLNESQFLTPLETGKWNAGQHLGHLWLSTKPISKALTIPTAVLASKFGLIDRPEHTYRELYAIYLDRLNKLSIKAPAAYVVDDVTFDDKEKYADLLNKELKALIKGFNAWSEEDLSKHVIPHPAFGPLSMREMLMFTDTHTRHHGKPMAKAKTFIVAA